MEEIYICWELFFQPDVVKLGRDRGDVVMDEKKLKDKKIEAELARFRDRGGRRVCCCPFGQLRCWCL